MFVVDIDFKGWGVDGICRGYFQRVMGSNNDNAGYLKTTVFIMDSKRY